MENEGYKKLALMLVVSFCVMYSVMFLNVSEVNHIYLSLTRFYMSILMTAPMALLMLFFMPKMYPNKKKNIIIKISGCIVFLLSLFLLRNQIPISDKQYMKAMIPHHSSAILTSRHANIKDPEVTKLDEGIIESQEQEIKQMKRILDRLEE